MNTYLIPTTAAFSYGPYDHIYMVYASSDKEAYTTAKILLDSYIPQKLSHYKSYKGKLRNIPLYPFHEDMKYDILKEILPKGDMNQPMAYFQVNWNKYTDELARVAAPENWSNPTYPNKGILANYIVKTYDKLSAEHKIAIGKDYALFNTGLFTKYYEPIYVYQSESDISFFTAYELNRLGISDRPERANYFKNPELLLFDWHYPIDIQFKHILDDPENKKRLPVSFLSSNNKINILTGAINTMIKKVTANYKMAIPQYYNGKIQLLLPLCLMDSTTPDIAIAVTKQATCYQGHKCLTLDMAYNNARLIARPQSNWLSN